MERAGRYGVYFIFQSMEQGATFRCAVPKFPTQDPNHRILQQQRSRYTHYYFYLRDETLGPMVSCGPSKPGEKPACMASGGSSA